MNNGNYTANQMAKLIVLGETVLRRRTAAPVPRTPALTLRFKTCEEVSLVEMAIADASAAVHGESPPIKDLVSRLGTRD